MQIEAGKYYRTHNWEIRGPAERNPSSSYPWNVPYTKLSSTRGFQGYRDDGTICTNQSQYDLVAEVICCWDGRPCKCDEPGSGCPDRGYRKEEETMPKTVETVTTKRIKEGLYDIGDYASFIDVLRVNHRNSSPVVNIKFAPNWSADGLRELAKELNAMADALDEQ